MKSLFSETESKSHVRTYAALPRGLALRIYTSRLIGGNSDLVLHGGGNTSVKLKEKNVLGEAQEVLFVKGSGVDLGTIQPQGFVGLDLNPLRRLRRLTILSDEAMENELQIRKISASSPDPSVEALLHAFLPHAYVDHTHADSVLILTNQRNSRRRVREALGERAAILPYIMSGFPLAKRVVAEYEKDPGIEALVILNHGIFTFAGDAKTSYERMIDYVDRAERYVARRKGKKSLTSSCRSILPPKRPDAALARFAQMARGVCAHRDGHGRLKRFYVAARTSQDLVDASLSQQAKDLCGSGVLTPDHAIRTKNRMIYVEKTTEADEELREHIRSAVVSFVDEYHRYFQEQSRIKQVEPEELDPYPRLFLVAGVGLVALGLTRKAAHVAADIGEHTVRAKLRAGAVGDYAPISDSHVFDMEYWRLQQKKLDRTAPPPLQGQVALVTGAGGAIGCGIAGRLLGAGAAVVISDVDADRLERAYSLLRERFEVGQIQRIVLDVTRYPSVEWALEEVSRIFGGLDILVPNAGIAHVAKIESLQTDRFDQVIGVNLKGTFHVIKASVPVFRRQGTGGNIVVISSKNVFDPGASFGAYSASKAGAHQISKIAALELAELGVRVNMINPDAVFGDEKVSSGLWDLVGPERMKSRGLDPEGLREYYRQRNLLKSRVLAEHVGNAVVFFASDLIPTTGATLPIDGGIPAAFPR